MPKQHISEPTREFYDLIAGNYSIFFSRKQIYITYSENEMGKIC